MRCRKDVQQLNIVTMFQMFTSFHSIGINFVQQPIVESVLNHLTPKIKLKFVNVDNVFFEKHNRSQIFVHQLLWIWIKCLMFCKHISLHFYPSPNWNFLNKHFQKKLYIFGHTFKKQNRCLCENNNVFLGGRKGHQKNIHWTIRNKVFK